MFLLFKFQQYKLFRKLKDYLKQAKNRLDKFLYRIREGKRHKKETISIIYELIRMVFGSFLWALFLFFVLEIAETFLISFLRQSNSSIVKNLLNHIEILYTNFASKETFETLLTTIASVSGVFITLYFTAISVVASSTYAKAPSEIRDLLSKETVGNTYMKNLFSLTVISLILLGSKLFGYQPGILNILFVGLFGCFGIFCFVNLGRRVFFFFDPTNLSDTIYRDILHLIDLSSIDSSRWSDSNSQFYYQITAAQKISTLYTFINICLDEIYLQRESLSKVLQNTIGILGIYEQRRKLIPSDSYWYPLKPQYKSWFLCDSIELNLALETQTSIQTEKVPNHYWIEDEIVKILSSTFETLIQKNNFEVIYKTIDIFNGYLGIIGSDLEIKKGRNIIETIFSSIEQYYDTHSVEQIKIGNENIELALFNIYGLNAMYLSSGFLASVNKFNNQDILKKIDTINWTNNKGIYKKDFEPLLLPTLELIYKNLKFEQVVEGRIISPKWYIRQLVITKYAELFQEAINELVSLFESFFVSKSKFLFSNKSFVFATLHSLRGLELWEKIEFHEPKMKMIWGEFEKSVIIKELPFPKLDWNEINNRINISYYEIVKILARCFPELSQVRYKENVPDLFGQTYYIICQKCYELLIFKNAEFFIDLFPPFFRGALSAPKKIVEQIKDWRPEVGLIITTEPLMDIMELSGYAKIYSELFNIPDFWNMCKTIWDGYFESPDLPPDLPKDKIKALINLYNIRKSSPQIEPRDLRLKWQMDFRNKLFEMNLIKSPSYHCRGTEVQHLSPLIRAICKVGYEVPAAEVFIITYLLQRKESAGIEFNDRWGLLEAIEQEEEINSKKDDDV